jgi:hypothetical protein
VNEQLELFSVMTTREAFWADWEVVPYDFCCLNVYLPPEWYQPVGDETPEMSS